MKTLLRSGLAAILLVVLPALGSYAQPIQYQASDLINNTPVSAANPLPVTAAPASAATSANTPVVSGAAEGSKVLKSSAGNLYALTVSVGATSGYVMIFDATSAPSDGAVTPKWCVPVSSNGTNGFVAAEWGVPWRFATGITAVFSTTGCFTKTVSATASFFGAVQ